MCGTQTKREMLKGLNRLCSTPAQLAGLLYEASNWESTRVGVFAEGLGFAPHLLAQR